MFAILILFAVIALAMLVFCVAALREVSRDYQAWRDEMDKAREMD